MPVAGNQWYVAYTACRRTSLQEPMFCMLFSKYVVSSAPGGVSPRPPDDFVHPLRLPFLEKIPRAPTVITEFVTSSFSSSPVRITNFCACTSDRLMTNWPLHWPPHGRTQDITSLIIITCLIITTVITITQSSGMTYYSHATL